MLCKEDTRPQLAEAAKVLGVEISFSDFQSGLIDLSPESKKKLIKVIREVKSGVNPSG